MQKTFCGVELNRYEPNEKNDELSDLELNRIQLRSVSLLYHIIYSNPVILYSPNTRLIRDSLISKANATFELFAIINEFSLKWLNSSDEIAEYLKQKSSRDQFLKDFIGIF